MTVLYFAHARRIAAVAQEEIPVATPLGSAEFWDLIILRHAGLAALRANSRLARGDDFLPPGAVIDPADEIAIIPPVSGG